MRFRLLRHATAVIAMNRLNLLLDPMFSQKESMGPIANAASQNRIPMVDLPLTETELRGLIEGLNGVLVTHVHRDHWDSRAAELLPKKLPVICQAEDEASMRQAGFLQVHPADNLMPGYNRQPGRGCPAFDLIDFSVADTAGGDF